MKIMIRILLASLTVFLSSCSTANNLTQTLSSSFAQPDISLVSIIPKSIDKGKISLDLNLLVKNPNAISIPLNNLNTDVKLNNINILNAQAKDLKTIPANGSEQISLTTEVDINLIQKLLLSLNSSKINYSLSGKAGLSNYLSIPINKSGTVDANELAKRAIDIYLK